MHEVENACCKSSENTRYSQPIAPTDNALFHCILLTNSELSPGFGCTIAATFLSTSFHSTQRSFAHFPFSTARYLHGRACAPGFASDSGPSASRHSTLGERKREEIASNSVRGISRDFK